MIRVGLISDTHGYFPHSVFKHFEECDEIWHAGDFGNTEVSDKLAQFKPLKGVYGNIDGQELRRIHPFTQVFNVEGLKILMIHIAGPPLKYTPEVRKLIQENQPGLLICGHSHIARIMQDVPNKLLYMNPGAAGNHGFHKVKTIMRFSISEGKLKDVELIELGNRGVI